MHLNRFDFYDILIRVASFNALFNWIVFFSEGWEVRGGDFRLSCSTKVNIFLSNTHFNSSLEFGAIKAWSTANLPQLLKWKLLQLRSFLTTIESTSKTILKRLFGMLSVFLMKNSNRTHNSILLSRRTIGY